MRRRRRGGEDGRDQFPAMGLCGFVEAGKPDIDLADGPDLVAQHHRGPAAAMYEGVIRRLGRRKGVGLVQEAADGYAGHRYGLGKSSERATLSLRRWKVQGIEQCRFAWALHSAALAAIGRKFAKSQPRPGADSRREWV